MPELIWNKTVWDRDYDWKSGGEEWSASWGGSEAQWFGSIFPRLHRFFPARRILEIAPGYGRWTKFLLTGCEQFIGVDLSAECIAACQKIFKDVPYAKFLQNDGMTLKGTGGEPFDLIFSFDSLVHADAEVLVSYIPEIIDRLSDAGIAFIHHSNFRASGAKINKHSRSENVDTNFVAELVQGSGGNVLHQELINWGGAELIDCFTLFSRMRRSTAPTLISNPRFMDEALIIKDFQSCYVNVGKINQVT